MPKFDWFVRLRTQFGTVLREGPDATSPSPILDFLAAAVGLCMLIMNTLGGIAILPWSHTIQKQKRQEHPSGMIWAMLDSNFRYVDMSPEFCTLLGFTRSQLIGRGLDSVTPEGFIDVQAFTDEIRRVRKRAGVWTYRRSDGTRVRALYRMEIGPNKMTDWVITPLDQNIHEDKSV